MTDKKQPPPTPPAEPAEVEEPPPFRPDPDLITELEKGLNLDEMERRTKDSP